MKYKLITIRRSPSKNRGVALVLTFMVMVAVVAIAVAFLLMLTTRAKGTGYDVASQKALWLAEAGLQDVMYNLRTDAGYRSDPSTVNGSLGDGTYSVGVSRNGSTYTLSSTGTVGVMNRQVAQTVIVSPAFPDAFDYAVFGNTNSSRLRLMNTVTVSGDLYYDGDVRVDANASVVDGLVYGDTVDGAGTYTEAPGPPDPVPAYPAFDTTYYDDQITTAEGAATSNWTLNGSDSYDLAGGTVYYKKVTIEDDATITGSGTIVATKAVLVGDNANISSDVKIITKTDITVRDSAVIQDNAVLYGRTGVTLQNSANVTGSLLAPESGKIATVKNSATLTGIIYADKARLRNDAVIDGSVVADSYVGNRIQDNINVTYDQSSFPDAVPTGMESGGVAVVPQRDWNEI